VVITKAGKPYLDLLPYRYTADTQAWAVEGKDSDAGGF
jgi:hypothetical protein